MQSVVDCLKTGFAVEDNTAWLIAERLFGSIPHAKGVATTGVGTAKVFRQTLDPPGKLITNKICAHKSQSLPCMKHCPHRYQIARACNHSYHATCHFSSTASDGSATGSSCRDRTYSDRESNNRTMYGPVEYICRDNSSQSSTDFSRRKSRCENYDGSGWVSSEHSSDEYSQPISVSDDYSQFQDLSFDCSTDESEMPPEFREYASNQRFTEGSSSYGSSPQHNSLLRSTSHLPGISAKEGSEVARSSVQDDNSSDDNHRDHGHGCENDNLDEEPEEEDNNSLDEHSFEHRSQCAHRDSDSEEIYISESDDANEYNEQITWENASAYRNVPGICRSENGRETDCHSEECEESSQEEYCHEAIGSRFVRPDCEDDFDKESSQSEYSSDYYQSDGDADESEG